MLYRSSKVFRHNSKNDLAALFSIQNIVFIVAKLKLPLFILHLTELLRLLAIVILSNHQTNEIKTVLMAYVLDTFMQLAFELTG